MKIEINRAYKTELKPNQRQLTLLRKSAGVARFTYNWGLARRIVEYQETGKSSNAVAQHKELVPLKAKEFPWMYEVSKCCPQEALRNLDTAYKNFFRRVKEGQKPGFPRFKRKHGKQSFRLNGSIHATASTVSLPRIGEVRLKERGYLPLDAKILSTTVSFVAGRWFVSLQVKEEIEIELPTNKEVLGIDLGIEKLATTSTGEIFENPRALKRFEPRLKRLQRKFSRQVKGSNNRTKTRLRLQKLHYRISCVRKDAIHKATSKLVKTKPAAIMLEDLSIQRMQGSRKIAKSLSDASMAEFKRQIEYKSLWSGIKVGHVGRFYPSSKTCSNCGFVKADLQLSDRTFTCPICGFSADRDLNAAINIKNQVREVLPEFTLVETV